MYYLITYVWSRKGKDVIATETHSGTIGEWMLKAIKEPEHWRLLNASEISETEFKHLEGWVG